MSNAEHEERRYGPSHLAALRNRIDDYSEVLYDDEFLARDLPMSRIEAKSVVTFLKSKGAIESVETFISKPDNKKINRWQWVNYQDDLQAYLEERDELPCGCRSHVPPETNDAGEYVCKFCGTPHSRDIIEGAL